MEQLFKLGSVSSAAKARRVLLKESIRGRMTKTGTGEDGCAWGIAVSGKDAARAAHLLRAEGIRYEAL